MKPQTQKPQNAKEFMQSLGLKFDETAKRGIRFEFKQNNLEIDGFRFPSESESKRYIELKLKAMRGEIQDLIIGASVGICYKLDGGNGEILKYYPTFVYLNRRNEIVAEDCRKIQSSENLKKISLMKELHGLTVRIIK